MRTTAILGTIGVVLLLCVAPSLGDDVSSGTEGEPLPELPRVAQAARPPLARPLPAPAAIRAPAPSALTAPPVNPPAAGRRRASALDDAGSILDLAPAARMLGDQGPNLAVRQVPSTPGLPRPFPPGTPPGTPSPKVQSSFAASVRGLKISENQSPQPQDRVFFSSNFYSRVNEALNQRFDAPVGGIRAYRQVFGFEKTFDGGNGSIGLRLPLDTITANSNISGNFAKPGGTSTALGDLSIFAKYIFKIDPATGSLVSGGIAITPPTGSSTFGGASYLQSIHATSIQPFVGYLWIQGNFYLHGFSSIDVPSTLRDATLVYNDLGVGYYLLRKTGAEADDFLTAIAPTFEVHANTPLTHRNPFIASDPGATANVVNLTYGLNMEFQSRTLVTFGFVTPVTGPRPFDFEALLLLNIRFGMGASGRRPANVMAGD